MNSKRCLKCFSSRHLIATLVFGLITQLIGCKSGLEVWKAQGRTVKVAAFAFDFPPFLEKDDIQLLQTMGYCVPITASAELISENDICSPETFRVVHLTEGGQEIILVESSSAGWSGSMGNLIAAYARRAKEATMIFETSGVLRGMQDQPNGKPPFLIIDHRSYELGMVTILHTWQDATYVPTELLQLNGTAVSEDRLDLHQKFIEEFPWSW